VLGGFFCLAAMLLLPCCGNGEPGTAPAALPYQVRTVTSRRPRVQGHPAENPGLFPQVPGLPSGGTARGEATGWGPHPAWDGRRARGVTPSRRASRRRPRGGGAPAPSSPGTAPGNTAPAPPRTPPRDSGPPDGTAAALPRS